MVRLNSRILVTMMFLLLGAPAFAEPQVHCGEIFEDEFTQKGEVHDFLLNLEPGTQMDLVAIPIGSTLKFHIKILEPTGNVTHFSNEIHCCAGERSVPNNDHEFVANARIKTQPLSSRGFHTIRVYNWNAGVYSLYVNCTLRDGREFKAGSEIYEPTGTPSAVRMPVAQTASSDGGQQQGNPGLQTFTGGDAKDQLKTAAIDFAKKKAMGWLSNKLANTAAGKRLGVGSGDESAGSVPEPVQPAAPRGNSGVAPELLVAAVSPSPQFTAPPAMPPAAQPATVRPAQPVSLDLGSAVPQGITLYSDKNFVGSGESFLDSDANLKDNAIGNDSASSLRISAGCSAILYADANFEGKSIIVTQDVVNLRDTRVGNDSISSIRVRCQGTAYF